MRPLLRLIVCLLALTINAPAVGAATSATFTASGTPAGFDELASSRETVVDVYFGDQKVAEPLAVTKPGSLQFRSPDEVLTKLPQVVAAPELKSAFAAELPTNSDVSTLVGRPVAVVAAAIRLELQGTAFLDLGWDQLGTDSDAGLTGIGFPVILGDLAKLSDGLIGFYKQADPRTPGGAGWS